MAVGRWRGFAALIGLAITWAVLVWFVLPAVLDGKSPLAVALVGSSVIMLFVLYLTRGLQRPTTTALLGTLVSLGLTGVLASVFVAASHITGLSSEEGVYLAVGGRATRERRPPRRHRDRRARRAERRHGHPGVGGLGAARRRPDVSTVALYRSAMRIGRDHIASTVDTLVLAYAGASLPLLILFTLADRRVGDILTSEMVAVEIVRTLVGSIGLVASVPLTTALAAVVVTRGRRRCLDWERFSVLG